MRVGSVTFKRAEKITFKNQFLVNFDVAAHTIYTINNMGQKCEADCGLWVLNEILKKYIC